ncbi:MAG: ABC transporter ATP-binding protein [Prevotella sp.]|nr:ABC transporter ATP-binding protein [Prevotella sp.]
MKEIILQQLTIGYRHKVVADGLSAVLRSGELTCLIGRNGLGKSTLLRTLSGFLQPLRGAVLLREATKEGNDEAELPPDSPNAREFVLNRLPKDRLAQLVSVVLTERVGVRQLTVEQLVGLGRMPYTGFFNGMSATDHRVVAEALRLTGMSSFAQREVSELSDGERQKVMIARALAQQTPVILLDEPTAFLDYGSKVETMRLLSDLAHRMDKLIVASTHDLEIALHTADRLLTIGDGGIKDLSKQQLKAKLEKYW